MDSIILSVFGVALTFGAGFVVGAFGSNQPSLQNFLVPIVAATSFLLPAVYLLVGWRDPDAPSARCCAEYVLCPRTVRRLDSAER